jgi:serine/threonine-protein kinase
VHRDLKPQNVFLAASKAGKPRIVVMDFGLARSTDIPNSNLTTTKGKIVGTPAYMAPEQTQGQKPSPAWDIYALGVILFQLASGRLPFQGAPGAVIVARRTERAPRLSALVPDIGTRVATIVAKCLELNPEHRFLRVEEIRELIVNPHRQPHDARTKFTMLRWILLGFLALLAGYWLSRTNLHFK